MKKLLSLFTFLFVALMAQAELSFSIDNVNIKAGEEKTLSVVLTNDQEAKSAAIDISLPAGLSFVGTNGSVEYSDRVSGMMLKSAKIQSSGALRVGLSLGTTIEVGTGEVFTFKVKADENVTLGLVKMSFTGMSITNTSNVKVTIPDAQIDVNIYKLVNISVAPDNNEKGIVSGGNNEAMYGSQATVTATANEGYHFVNWTSGETAVSTDNPYVFTVTDDINLVANFALNQYTMTFVLGNGEADVVRTQDYNSTLTALTPTKNGYTFKGWNPEVPATVPAENITFTAQWEAESWAQGWTSSEVGSGEFYLYNVGANGFIVGANNWGTRASIDATGGIPVTLTGSDGVYTISTSPTYDGRYLGSDGYVDNGTAADWVFEAVPGESKVYKIKCGDNYLYADAVAEADLPAKTTTLGADPGTNMTYWRLISKENLFTYFESATELSSVWASSLIKNPGFGRNSNKENDTNKGWGWDVNASNKNMSGGTNENRCAEHWQSAFTVKQTISDVPNGTYRLRLQAALTEYTVTGNDLPVVYIKSSTESTATFKTMTNAENSMDAMSASFSEGKYFTDYAEIDVLNGEIEIGVRGTRTDTWCVYDNFQLLYCGPIQDLTPYIGAYEAALENAKSIDLSAKMSTSVKAALQNAISTYDEGKVDQDNQEALEIATAALGSATAKAETSIASYAIITAGSIPNNSISGWTNTGTGSLEVNTWSTESGPVGNDTRVSYDGTGMTVPFIQSWVWKGSNNDVFLGNGTVSYTLAGLEPGEVYYAQALVRTYSEGGNVPNGPDFFINNVVTDMTTNGTAFDFAGMKGFYGTLGGVATVGEDGKIVLGVTIQDANYNWVAFKNVSIQSMDDAFNAAVAKVTSLDGTVPPSVYNTAYAVVTDYSDANKPTTAAGYEIAITAIEAAATTASAYVEPYAAWTAAKNNAETNYGSVAFVATVIDAQSTAVEAADEVSDVTTAITELNNAIACYNEWVVVKNNAESNYGNVAFVTKVIDAQSTAVEAADEVSDVNNAIAELNNAIVCYDAWVPMKAYADDLVAVSTNNTDENATLASVISTQNTIVEAATTADDITTATSTLKTAMTIYATTVQPTNDECFDLTFMLVNPHFKEGEGVTAIPTGWDLESGSITEHRLATHNFEAYHMPFNLSQTIEGLPKGTYKVTLQGFARHDDANVTDKTNLYCGVVNQKIKDIKDEYSTTPIFESPMEGTYCPLWESVEANYDTPYTLGEETVYQPNGMTGSYYWFQEVNPMTNKPFYTTEVQTLITEDGDLKIGFKCETNQDWVIWDNFHLYYYGSAIEVTIDEDETGSIYEDDIENANITLKRTFSIGNWNTIALPFDLSDAETKTAFGSDAEVATYSETADGTSSIVTFEKAADAAITANVPVLLKTNTTETTFTFNGKTIKAGEAKVKGMNFDFVGTYTATTTIPESDYFISRNQLWKSAGETSIKGTRAYLKANVAEAEARIGDFRIGDSESTGIVSIDNGVKSIDNAMFDLQGRKVANVKKGLYIKNSKKVVVR